MKRTLLIYPLLFLMATVFGTNLNAQCVDPSGLSASNITSSSVDLVWVIGNAETNWNIKYGAPNFDPDTDGILVNASVSPSHTLSGLDIATDYEAYVQADCGGTESGWVSPVSFSTLCAPSTGTDVQTACVSFDWIDGNTYTADVNDGSVTHTIVGGDINGCDSTVTLDLTINNPTTGTDVQTACGSFTWIDGVTYTADESLVTHTLVGGAFNGCDSIVTLDLTINPSNYAGSDNSTKVCMNEPFDLDSLLSSDAPAGGTWMSPTNLPIPSTKVTASSVAGTYSYTYVVSSADCPDAVATITITVLPTCDYLVGVSTEALMDISVYPNPSSNVLNIVNPSNTSSLKVEMLDMNGRVVLVESQALNNATQASIVIDHLQRGIYTLRVYNEEGQKTFKIVKQ
ncbi:MAG TPA: T9SS type A sorting domain-containing protein [Brumimicrobium sp.]|nr:T9SS type A sorting domain-containing protein [Brumimicrobium sp.]